MEDNVLEELQASVNICSFNDKNKLEDFINLRNKIDELVDSTIEHKNGKTFSDDVRSHINVIKKRAEGKRTSIGESQFDSLFPNPQAGIIVIGGYSGSMKSTYIHKLLQNRIVKHLPTTFFNSELSDEGVMDSVTPYMIKENINDVMGINNDDEHIDYQEIISKYEQIALKYDNTRTYLRYPSNSFSLADIKNFNKEARKQFGLKDDELLICFVDMLSMVSDFNKGSNRADAIKLGMDEFNKNCLEDNTLAICTLQFLRPKTIHINKEEDIDKFRMSASDLKDGSEWENRSRGVLGIFNRRYFCEKMPCDPIVKELTEPILDITVLKNTYTKSLGQRIYYEINSDYKALIPYPNYENKQMEENK